MASRKRKPRASSSGSTARLRCCNASRAPTRSPIWWSMSLRKKHPQPTAPRSAPRAGSSTPLPERSRYLRLVRRRFSHGYRLFRFAIDRYAPPNRGKPMAKSRIIIFSLLLALPVLWSAAPARADQAFQRLMPLLVDLDGWQGKKPDGMSMEMPNGSMTTATREYQKGPGGGDASVMVGQVPAGALAPMQAGMNITTSEGHMLSGNMHGMQVLKSYTPAQKSGALLVALDKEAMFSLSYNGLSEDEALALAE